MDRKLENFLTAKEHNILWDFGQQITCSVSLYKKSKELKSSVFSDSISTNAQCRSGALFCFCCTETSVAWKLDSLRYTQIPSRGRNFSKESNST